MNVEDESIMTQTATCIFCKKIISHFDILNKRV